LIVRRYWGRSFCLVFLCCKGLARYADEPNIFAMKVDGSARKLSGGLFIEWSKRNARWEITAFGQEIKQIESGDVIVVPEKLTHIAWLKQIRDRYLFIPTAFPMPMLGDPSADPQNPLMFFIKKAIYHSRFLNFGHRD